MRPVPNLNVKPFAPSVQLFFEVSIYPRRSVSMHSIVRLWPEIRSWAKIPLETDGGTWTLHLVNNLEKSMFPTSTIVELNQNSAECIKAVNDFSETIYNNICNGTITHVPTGIYDYMIGIPLFIIIAVFALFCVVGLVAFTFSLLD